MPHIQSRRAFLLGACTATATLATPAIARSGTTNTLRMVCPVTGEKFAEVLIENGHWVESAVAAFDHFARDWRAGIAAKIERDTLKMAIRLQSLINSPEPFHLLSAYRTPQTNRRLRGAAQNSMHVQAAAFDLRQPDRSNGQVYAAALSLKAGGVGRYSRFVHIDSGQLRNWRG